MRTFLLQWALFTCLLFAICYGVYDRTAVAHNEVTLITFCKDHLNVVTAPFEDTAV